MVGISPYIPPTIAAKISSRYALAMTNETVTREDLVAILNEEVGLSRAECSDLLKSVLNEITTTLGNGETVKIHRFATFIPH